MALDKFDQQLITLTTALIDAKTGDAIGAILGTDDRDTVYAAGFGMLSEYARSLIRALQAAEKRADSLDQQLATARQQADVYDSYAANLAGL